jgi:bacteriocin-like protein
MLDEKKSQAVELTDDELEQVSGGGDTTSYRVTATSTCGRFLGSGEALCKNCKFMKRVCSVQNRTYYYCTLGRL